MDTGKIIYDPFEPAAPEYRWKLWTRVVTEQKSYTHFFWRRIAATLALTTLLLWLAAAAGTWIFVKYQRGVTGARYVDLVLPHRWPQYRVALGHHYLELGRRHLAQREYLLALTHLMAGVHRVPDDIAGRRLLAITCIRLGRVDLGLRTLSEGLTHARDDLDYLKLAFALLLEAQEDDRVIEFAQQLLPATPDGQLHHRFIALQAATAHFHRGRYDPCEALIHAWGLAAALEGQLLLARCDWERGYRELAVQRLENEIPRFPHRDELHLELLGLLRELGRLDAARRQALLRQFSTGSGPGPRIDRLHSLGDSNDAAALHRETEQYLADFARDPGALILLAWYGVDRNDRQLVRRVRELALAAKLPPNAFNLAVIQAELEALDFKAARAAAIMALRQDEENLPVFNATVAGLEAVALYGLGEKERSALMLKSFLRQQRIRTADALYLARQLDLLNARDEARLVLATLALADVFNQAALTELIRLDLRSGNRPGLLVNLPLLLKMRKPSRGVLEEAWLFLNSPADAALRAEIKRCLDGSPRQTLPAG